MEPFHVRPSGQMKLRVVRGLGVGQGARSPDMLYARAKIFPACNTRQRQTSGYCLSGYYGSYYSKYRMDYVIDFTM
jgi:hypothetical protein